MTTSPWSASLRAYSTVGTRGDVDLLLLAQAPALDEIHTFHVVLAQSGLARWASIPFLPRDDQALALLGSRGADGDLRLRAQVPVRVPVLEEAEWYRLPADERQRIMSDHIEIGRRYPEITINTALVRARRPGVRRLVRGRRTGRFLDLVQELRSSESSSYYAARHADLHLRRDVRGEGARRARRHRDGTQRAGTSLGLMPGTPDSPLRVAIVGSGPAGFYAADHLLRREGVAVEVDMLDRLPTLFARARRRRARPSEDQVGDPGVREDRRARRVPVLRQRPARARRLARRARRALPRRDLRLRRRDRPPSWDPRRRPSRSGPATASSSAGTTPTPTTRTSSSTSRASARS